MMDLITLVERATQGDAAALGVLGLMARRRRSGRSCAGSSYSLDSRPAGTGRSRRCVGGRTRPCPQHLRDPDISRRLQGYADGTASGTRDEAILPLLSRRGLRAKAVASLHLHDVACGHGSLLTARRSGRCCRTSLSRPWAHRHGPVRKRSPVLATPCGCDWSFSATPAGWRRPPRALPIWMCRASWRSSTLKSPFST